MQRRSHARGFTLIELLVVVAIVGILTATAIPQYAAYRAKGFDARIAADARSAAAAEESYFADKDAYLTGGDCALLPGMIVSDGVTCRLHPNASTTVGFRVRTRHPNASFTAGCVWDSDRGTNLVCA